MSSIDWRSYAILSLALLGAVALRVGFAPQFDGLDDAGYLEAAHRVSRGVSLDSMFPLFRTRVGMAYPLGWCLRYSLLDPSHFWILTTGADLIALLSLFAAARAVADVRAGLLAVLLYGQYPLAVQQAAMFYPTAFQVGLISLAVALLCSSDRVNGTGRRAFMAMLAGVALGLAYLVKEDGAVVVMALAIAALISRFLPLSRVAWCCAGAGAVLTAECAGYWLIYGHPLYRITTTSGLASVTVVGQLRMSEIWRWYAYLKSLFLLPVQVGAIWWLSIPAFFAALKRSDRAFRFIAATLLVVCCYLQFGTASTRAYVSLPKTPRYTAIATPFLIILVAVWLSHLGSIGRKKSMAWIVIALMTISAPCLIFLDLASSERMRNTLAAVPILRNLRPGRLYTDYYTARILTLIGPQDATVLTWYHADFPNNLMLIQTEPDRDSGAYVLLDYQASKIYTSSYEMRLPAQVVQPRPGWTIVWTHRAYADGSASRVLLEQLRSLMNRCPGNPVCSRISRNVGDMIDNDRATLYRTSAEQ